MPLQDFSAARVGIVPQSRNTTHEEDQMAKVITCPCGFVLRGETDDEVVQKAQEHARETHSMTLSREQALSMAKPE
jgi:predicted small metal-binding protein